MCPQRGVPLTRAVGARSIQMCKDQGRELTPEQRARGVRQSMAYRAMAFADATRAASMAPAPWAKAHARVAEAAYEIGVECWARGDHHGTSCMRQIASNEYKIAAEIERDATAETPVAQPCKVCARVRKVLGAAVVPPVEMSPEHFRDVHVPGRLSPAARPAAEQRSFVAKLERQGESLWTQLETKNVAGLVSDLRTLCAAPAFGTAERLRELAVSFFRPESGVERLRGALNE